MVDKENKTRYEISRNLRYSYTLDSKEEDFVKWCEENGHDPENAGDHVEEYAKYNIDEHDYCFEEEEIELECVY